ncbi:MAG: lipase family protein [Polyangiaceae bacterium]
MLAFRGTEPDNLINWLTDAESAKYPFGNGYVHSGFFANVEALWANIVQLIDPLVEDAKIKKLYITGHSLCAAMAVVAAAQIFKYLSSKSPYAKWRDCIRGIYSFAQPMVGDAEFAAEFHERFGGFLYRYTYDQDVVPCLPPTSVDTNFVHFGVRRFAHTCEEEWTVGGADRRAELGDLALVAGSFFTRRIDALRILGMRLCPYSLDDRSPRGYIDVTRNALMPRKARAKPVSPSAARTPLTLFEALSQAVEQAISVPEKVLESLRSVRLRPTGGNGCSATAPGALTSGQSHGGASGS